MEEAATNWQAMQDKWHSHIAQLHQRAADKKAEYAVLDAALARSDADAFHARPLPLG